MSGNFFDTDVLVYPLARQGPSAEIGASLIARGGSISVQVLNEIVNVARKKMRLPWPHTREFLTDVRGVLTVHPLTLSIHERGLAIAERYQLSVYDAMIVATAMDTDCDILWSEDMQDGVVVDGRLRITNPFANLNAI